MKGYVQIYTGNTSYQTYTSLGNIVRAAGAKLKVFIFDFMQDESDYDFRSLSKLDNVTIRRCKIDNENLLWHQDGEKKKAFLELCEILRQGEYDMVIINCHLHIIPEKEVVCLIDLKQENTELIITGIQISDTIIDKADLITEQKEIK